MKFLSDNAAPVHPKVWDAMRAADDTDAPYDGDAFSRALDDAFSALFQRECSVIWTATGTAANCLALACLCPPWGGIVCHRDAHVEGDEGGAPGFYTHGAKLMLAGGDGARVSPETIAAVIDPIRDDVHRVQPHAVAITQASEYGAALRPSDVAAIAAMARDRGLRVHMDGARFANAVAFLDCTPAEAGPGHGIDSLAFGCIKNGAMSAEALVLFDPSLADEARRRRKRAGHLQSKGRFVAVQLLAMLDGDLWLENARAANAAATRVAEGAKDRLLHPVEANELFVKSTPDERAALRAQGFEFYDWDDTSARFGTAWNTREDDAAALSRALSAL